MIKIHPTSDVQSSCIGKGTIIWQFCVVLGGARIGNNCNINCNVFIENEVKIGDNVTIKSGVQIWDGISIGSNVFIGPNATFTNDPLPRSKQYPVKFATTIIDNWASIGANATIMAGVIIGQYAMVGAGSVLTKSAPPFTLWYGNPARQRGFVTRKGQVISHDLLDKSGNKYIIHNFEPLIND